jgi:hypothetical protein
MKKRMYWVIGTLLLAGIFIILNFYLKRQYHGVYEWLPSLLFIPLIYGINAAFFNYKLLPNSRSLIAVCTGVILAVLDTDLQGGYWIQKMAGVLVTTFMVWLCFYRRK